MSRRGLTSNRRSFRRNSRSFLNQISKSPIDILVDDGVNPPYTIAVNPVNNVIQNQDELEDAGLTTTANRPRSPTDELEDY